MQIVTLTTDWKDGDYNIGRLKACILSFCKDATVVDITHSIQPFNTLQAAFVLQHSYKYFPKNSIHIVGVNSEPSPQNQIAVMRADDHYFIGCNDGLLGSICDKTPDCAVELPYNINPQGFRALNIYSQCVKLISENVALEEVGNICEINQNLKNRPTCHESRIVGSVIYIDSFGNAITNIDKATFDRIARGRKFEISAQSNYIRISQLSAYYDDVKAGKILAIFNSIGLLELAINQGNISQLQSLNTSSAIMINFED